MDMKVAFTRPDDETLVWVEFDYMEETTEEEVHEKASKAVGTEDYEYGGYHHFPFDLEVGDADEISSYLEVLNSYSAWAKDLLSGFDSEEIKDLAPEEVQGILEAMVDTPVEVIKAYLENYHWHVPALTSMKEEYKGKFDSMEAYAKSLYEGNEAVAKVEAMGLYIDWKKVAYDMERSGCWIEDGHVFENS